jgi:hypothetical protein
VPVPDPQMSLPSGIKNHIPNPIQRYVNHTYNIRLTMMPSTEVSKKREQRSYNYKTGIVLAETGGTGAVFCEHLTIKMTPGNSGGYNALFMGAMESKMKLVEPLGAKFIHSFSLAAYDMGYPNNSNALCLLEVWFAGYDTDDKPVNPLPYLDGNAMIYRWYVSIATMDMSLDYRGSFYDITFIDSINQALSSEFIVQEDGFKVKGAGTVDSFLKEFETVMNQREADRVKAKVQTYPNKWNFKADKELGPKKIDQIIDGTMKKTWAYLFGPSDIQIAKGMKIDNVIYRTLANSKDVKEFMNRVKDGKKEYNSIDTKENTIHIPPRTLMILSASVPLAGEGGFKTDPALGPKPVYELYYYATTQMNSKPIVGPQELLDAQSYANRKKRLEMWVAAGYVKKVYKWIYTGENTEVLGCDLKLNNLWRVARPLYMTEDGKVIPASTSGATNRKPSDVPRRSPPNSLANMARAKTFGNIAYAEDFPKTASDAAKTKSGWKPHLPQLQLINQSGEQTQIPQALNREHAMEVSIFNQIHGGAGASGDLMNLNIEIVGDPYWIAQVPPQNKTGAGRPQFTDDLWEYWKDRSTPHDKTAIREKVSLMGRPSMFYFEAQVPTPLLRSNDTMDLQETDVISGLYTVMEMTHKFEKGKYTTILHGVRDTLSSPYPKGNSAPPTTGVTPNATGNNSTPAAGSGALNNNNNFGLNPEDGP